MVGGRWRTNRDLKIHRLLRERTHIIIQAKAIFPRILRSEDKIALPFLGGFENGTAVGAHDGVIDVKRTA